MYFTFFLFTDTATTEIYTLSLHDALPISHTAPCRNLSFAPVQGHHECIVRRDPRCARTFMLDRGFFFTIDRKSTRLNSSHMSISYAVFCLKKKRAVKC